MTLREALAAVRTDPASAARFTDDPMLILVRHWRRTQPAQFDELLEAAGSSSPDEARNPSKLDRLACACATWRTPDEAATLADIPRRSLRQAFYDLKARGLIVEKRRRLEGHPGFVFRVRPRPAERFGT